MGTMGYFDDVFDKSRAFGNGRVIGYAKKILPAILSTGKVFISKSGRNGELEGVASAFVGGLFFA